MKKDICLHNHEPVWEAAPVLTVVEGCECPGGVTGSLRLNLSVQQNRFLETEKKKKEEAKNNIVK